MQYGMLPLLCIHFTLLPCPLSWAYHPSAIPVYPYHLSVFSATRRYFLVQQPDRSGLVHKMRFRCSCTQALNVLLIPHCDVRSVLLSGHSSVHAEKRQLH